MTDTTTSCPALAEARIAFLDSLVGKSPYTTHTYKTALDRFAEYLANRKIPATAPTREYPRDVLERYYTWLVRQYGRETRSTHATYVAGVRAFFRFLERRGWGPADTTFEQLRAGLQAVMGRGSYKTPRVDSALALIVTYVDSLPVPATGGEPAAQRKRLELLRDRALIRTLFCTGMRRSEVASLNRVDVADGRTDEAIITGKGAKERVVFFDEPTLEAIRAYLSARNDNYQPLFIRHDLARGKPRAGGTNYRISTQTIFDTVKRYAAAVGIDVSPHDFRHVKASTMLNAGASLSEVQDILGHASPDTTKRIYAHYETARLREAFHRFSVSAEDLAKKVNEERAPRAGDKLR